MDGTFALLAEQLAAEDDVRESVLTNRKELEASVLRLQESVQAAHSRASWSPDDDQDVLARNVGKAISATVSKIPEGEFFRYHDIFHSSLVNAVSCLVLLRFLTGNMTDRQGELSGLPTAEDLCSELGIGKEYILAEDYLHGICNSCSELSRLCVARVTLGDFNFPIKVHRFATCVFSGFRLLNLRNDALRRRFDGMKYDVKRISEVVYDLTIRGLVKVEQTSQPGAEPLP